MRVPVIGGVAKKSVIKKRKTLIYYQKQICWMERSTEGRNEGKRGRMTGRGEKGRKGREEGRRGWEGMEEGTNERKRDE